MQNDAQAKDAEVDECDIEDLLPTLVNVGDVPLVSELVVAQSPTEHVLDYGKSTMMKQVKKEYTVTTSRATFLLLVCIIINNQQNQTIRISPLLFLYRCHLYHIDLSKCDFLLVIFVEAHLQGELHLHQHLHMISSLLTKFSNECPSRTLVHRVDIATADAHSELHELHVDAFLLCTEGRVHHHQVCQLASQLQTSHIGMDQVKASSLNFLLKLISRNINIFIVQLDTEGICCSNKHHSADQHASPNSKVCNQL